MTTHLTLVHPAQRHKGFLAPATPAGRHARQRSIRRAVGCHAEATAELDAMVHNVLAVWDERSDADQVGGRTWYPEALAHAQSLGIDTGRAVGIMAALSPSTDWDRNLSLARTMVETGDCGHAYGECIRRARAIRDGADPGVVLGGRKVRSFYQAIMSGGTSAHVVVDRHAHAVAMGVDRPLPDAAAKELNIPGRYQLVAAGYRGAARAAGVPVSVIQATTWLTFRREYGGRAVRAVAA